jgi:hypothetical protein
METATIGFVFLLIALLAVLYMAMTVVPPVRTIESGKAGLPGVSALPSEEADAINAEWINQFNTLTKIKILSPELPAADVQPSSRTSSWPVLKGYKDASGNWI